MILPEIFTVERLLEALLNERDRPWLEHVEIIPDYLPPNPREDTRPRCVVCFRYTDKRDNTEERCFLRYSHGPGQGHFWDIYGDDYLRPELALLALSQAQPPPPAMGRYFSLKFSLALGPQLNPGDRAFIVRIDDALTAVVEEVEIHHFCDDGHWMGEWAVDIAPGSGKPMLVPIPPERLYRTREEAMAWAAEWMRTPDAEQK